MGGRRGGGKGVRGCNMGYGREKREGGGGTMDHVVFARSLGVLE